MFHIRLFLVCTIVAAMCLSEAVPMYDVDGYEGMLVLILSSRLITCFHILFFPPRFFLNDKHFPFLV